MNIYFLIIIFLINFFALSGSIAWSIFKLDYEPVITCAILTCSFIVSSKELHKHIKIFRKTINLPVTLMGFVNSGKSVYLAVLFDELQKSNQLDYYIFPYGADTIKKILKDTSTLNSGTWLSRTCRGEDFYYQAFITSKNKLLNKKYLLEMGDFSGEIFRYFNQENNDIGTSTWLHDESFFEYVLHSKGIFFAVDLEFFITKNKSDFYSNFNLDDILNMFIATIHIIAEKKGVDNNYKIEIPICILFLKSDLIETNKINKDYIVNLSERLLKVCENRCRFFAHFFISSVGTTEEIYNQEHIPKTPLKPINVTEPIIWLLDRVKI